MYDSRQLRPTDLEVGREYFECSSGMNLRLKVLTAPESVTVVLGKERKQWRWLAETYWGAVDCLVTEGLEQYGPHMYTQPQYFHIRGDEIVFFLQGEDEPWQA